MTLGAALVVGPGRAGTAIAAALASSGVAVTLAGRRPVDDAALPDGVRPWTDAGDAVDVLVLAVPDPAVPHAALAWADRVPEQAAVLHLSGARGASALPASLGDRRGCAHPLMSLGGAQDAARLRGAFFAIDGEGRGRDAAVALAEAVGGVPGDVPEDARAAYHAAAVLASNGVFALARAAEDVARAAGLEDAALRTGLMTLLVGSAARLAETAPTEAATGPVVRGDATTVQRHLHALPEGPPSTELYRSVQRVLIDVAEDRRLPAPLLAALRAVLYDEPA